MNNTRRIPNISLFVTALAAVLTASAWGSDGSEASRKKEGELLAVLRGDAPAADKAMACKHLVVYGSEASVPDLAKLLADANLASWARIPLEVIPGSAADEALRKAIDSLQGNLLVGVLNSIGVRRDAGAVERLAARLSDADADVASAAAVALGRIGNVAASQSLRRALAASPAPVRSAIAEGCVLCAERFLTEGRSGEATEIYDEVRNANVPRPRVLEATRGSILARKDAGIGLLIEQFRSSDKAFFNIGLSTAREFPGNRVDDALAAELERTTPDRASLILLAMADRRETVNLPAVLNAAVSGPKEVRLAAIGALGRVGNGSCLPALLEIALAADPDLAQTAKTALSDLPGENVNQEILTRLAKAEGNSYPLLIGLVGERRIAALPQLLKALDHSDRAVRTVALTSLGATIPASNLSLLISQTVAPKHAEDAQAAEQALKAACVRMPDREACAAELAAALDRSSPAKKPALLEILGAVGGTKALQTLGAAAKGSDVQLQDASTRLLGEWMTIDAAPVLLDLAKTAREEKFQVRALRGYIRIARQFTMPDRQRAEMCENALEAARQTAEQKLVLDVVKRYPSQEMLKVTARAMQIADLKEDATQATTIINEKPKGKRGKARGN